MDNEQGSVTIISLLILVILTLVGIGALTSSTSDLQASRSERVYRQNFSRAEAAVRAGAMAVKENKTTPFDPACPNWMHDPLPSSDITNAANWSVANSSAGIDADCRFVVLYAGTPTDLGEGASGEKSHEYTIFGRSSEENGEVIVQVGYILVF